MKRPVRIALIVSSVFIILIGLTVGVFFLLISPDINIAGAPDLDMSQLTSYSRTVTIYDKDGNILDDALYEKNKVYVRLDELPVYVPRAFVAIEDKRFYAHGGIDYRRIAAATISNIKSGAFTEGASTITQQLIKNTHLTNEKTLKRKISEMRLARQLEKVYDKDRILESYLNILYFGSGIQGLGTASRVMFDKPASELTVAQAAALASIINNPAKYSPYNNPQNLEKRKNLVLDKMSESGYITDTERDTAKNEHIVFSKNRKNQFVRGLLKSAAQQYNCTEKQLFLKNLSFRTAYDKKITQSARDAISKNDKYGCTIRVLTLDNVSGGIACDETNSEKYIDVRRSPASTVKPFISYAPALENGMTPYTYIDDSPTEFGDYAPKNYKNVYRGRIPIRDALAYSSNIAAVKLMDGAGPENAKNVAKRFGIPFSQTDGSLSVALGGMERGVTLIELANAYRTLANGGLYGKASYYTEKPDLSPAMRAVNDDTAYLITDMLKGCASYGTAKKLKYSGHIAAKTGTNGDKKGNYDCYCIAYTPKYTVAVWFGAKNGGAIDNSVTGATACDIVKYMIDDGAIDTKDDFTVPDSVAYYEIDGKALRDDGEVYLADPMLPKRYRVRALLSKRFLPIKKPVDIIDYFDRIFWDTE